jgi:hypothetical protein
MPETIVEHARRLMADTRAIRTESLMLKVHAQEVRGARSIRGASDIDVPAFLSLITDAAMCGDCLSLKSGAPRASVDDGVRRMARTVKITTKLGRCAACLARTVVHQLG